MGMFYKIISLLGGLSLFLYGMHIMGDGLKSSSGTALKAALAKVTNKSYMGFILGVLVTCMIQSSTATIVLTVGLVGAGFLTFRQSIGIVLGANVGTSITAQIIRLMDLDAGASSFMYFFKSDNLAPMALIIGIVLIMFVKSRTSKNAGTICMGFGILFVGLMNMSNSVSAMKDVLSSMLISFENNYFMGFLAGVVTTGIIQSSSAVVGILQSMASSVGVTFCGVFSVILGVNIGDCLTTYLVCRIGAKTEQIRTVLIHIIYNIFALVLIVVAITVLRTTGILNDSIWYMTLHSGGVANVHGLFRLIPAILLLPFTSVFAAIAEKLVPEKVEVTERSKTEDELRQLDERLLVNPGLALNETQELITHMAMMSAKNYSMTIEQFSEYDEKNINIIKERENTIDLMADACNQYLVKVSPHIALDSDENTQNFQMKAIIAFERIGDLSINLLNSIIGLHREGKEFSPHAKSQLKVAIYAVTEILDRTVHAFSTNRIDIARKVEPLEEVIDELIDELKERHLDRVKKKTCDMTAAIVFQEMLQNLERISDQCSDLAVYLLAKEDENIRGTEHRYIHNLHHQPDDQYSYEFEVQYDRMFDMLNAIED